MNRHKVSVLYSTGTIIRPYFLDFVLAETKEEAIRQAKASVTDLICSYPNTLREDVAKALTIGSVEAMRY